MKKKVGYFLTSLLSIVLVSFSTSCGHPTASEESTNSTPTIQTSETTSSETSESLLEKYSCLTISQAIQLAKEVGEGGTNEAKAVYGTIKSIDHPTYGQMTLTDGSNTLSVFGINGWNDLTSKPTKGDEIALSGILKTYKDEAEMDKSDILEFIHVAPQYDSSEYQSSNIKAARKLPANSKVKTTGVVANITYGQKKTPNGYFLVDDTSSIYVYDKDNISNIKVGNKITILATRDNYISSKETESAEKFGYTGCIQLKDVIILENDGQNHEYDKTWITEKSIKEILNTPTNENNTTLLYKTTGIIKKVPGDGFTNYYINDLDNKTGSYTYTSSNGADFAWLDQFDNKICDIYLSAINAKCVHSGIIYRFMPITVSLSDFTLTDEEVGKFVIDYKVKDKFLTTYNADPSLELENSDSDDILNYKNVALSYSSSDESIIYFETTENGYIMHTNNEGSATITITATYKGIVTNESLKITYTKIEIPDAVNVKKAIDTPVNTKLKIRGIVVSSLVNQDGFYLGDETGVIAVKTTKETLKTLKLGNEIYIEGTRNVKSKDGFDGFGQSYIDGATVLLNKYGEHQYSTASFIQSSIEEINKFDYKEDHTTQGYIVKGKVLVTKGTYATTLSIVSASDPNESISLYSSSGAQYSWLAQFKDCPEVTLEIMLCNWNAKKYYRGCVISCSDGTNKVVNNLNFANNA